ncbi:hypothetical protein CK203_095038 [Vitis vinifera]|uniref:Uncharacterized protein n=1 Tax=Vitis vinifera TaxID=29760 RepID=A0A438C706_VITVI|nr:hypothetical protein CK203_095038 [Vitis vinifera]
MDRRQRRNPSASSSAFSSPASSSSRFRSENSPRIPQKLVTPWRMLTIEKQMWEATKTRARGGRRARSEQSSLLSWNLPLHVPWTFLVLLPFMPPVPHADVTTLVLFCTNRRKILFLLGLGFKMLFGYMYQEEGAVSALDLDLPKSPLLFELGSMKGGWMWAEEGRFDLCATGLQYQFVPELDKAHKLVGKFHYLVTTEFQQYGHKEGRRRGRRENPNCPIAIFRLAQCSFADISI